MLEKDRREQFKADLRAYWMCEGRDLRTGSDLLEYLRSPIAQISESDFKWHLADAILNQRFSVEEYERLTDLDFETREQVAVDLSELWCLMFGEEVIALPSAAV
ncbi:hypothetical protein ACS5PN_10170 [Roseateles sp. NT4]|uniref:hypothetical protein n=1 Tax=Roseateles sp. NT4 TaxID=3453715 RepID=UPI003EEC6288